MCGRNEDAFKQKRVETLKKEMMVLYSLNEKKNMVNEWSIRVIKEWHNRGIASRAPATTGIAFTYSIRVLHYSTTEPRLWGILMFVFNS